MENNDNRVANLPRNINKMVPDPKPDAKTITSLVRDNGRVSGYQLSDGQVVSKQEGIEMAKAGGIRGVGIATRKGSEYLRTLPDSAESNNLGNLPSISDK